MPMTVSAAWSHKDLAKEVCDDLVRKGELKASPAFIRSDREAKLVEIFRRGGLDGAKVLSLPDYKALQIRVRLYAHEQVWVEQVLSSMLEMLPRDNDIHKKEMQRRQDREDARRSTQVALYRCRCGT